MEEMLGRLSSFSITEEEATVIGIPDDVVEKGRKEARLDCWGKSYLLNLIIGVRVYNLPYDGMIREIGEKIGNGIGKFLDVVTDKNGRFSGMYMRLRVQIDVSKPLRRGATVQLGSNGVMVWTSFKYERLPDFCFGCGRIGHGRLECVDDKVRNANASDCLFYSPELRADTRSERCWKFRMWSIFSIGSTHNLRNV
ncbi:hypothetical protein TIFTF001_013533 [Ficus carica]|uniref:CCHC-type domain-containing protein n=1 Tax=Ficus carica TaxID=3494 RepID=A0AA88D2Y5_FICCA|nr:hypothetical protein TIFTF001_013533 [Ficus carica]